MKRFSVLFLFSLRFSAILLNRIFYYTYFFLPFFCRYFNVNHANVVEMAKQVMEIFLSIIFRIFSIFLANLLLIIINNDNVILVL